MNGEKEQKTSPEPISVRRISCFFLTISAVVTFCFLLFMSSMDINFADVKGSAIIAFVNVVFALVKRVIDIFGGEISGNSTPGKGSTFIVPLGRAD